MKSSRSSEQPNTAHRLGTGWKQVGYRWVAATARPNSTHPKMPPPRYLLHWWNTLGCKCEMLAFAVAQLNMTPEFQWSSTATWKSWYKSYSFFFPVEVCVDVWICQYWGRVHSVVLQLTLVCFQPPQGLGGLRCDCQLPVCQTVKGGGVELSHHRVEHGGQTRREESCVHVGGWEGTWTEGALRWMKGGCFGATHLCSWRTWVWEVKVCTPAGSSLPWSTLRPLHWRCRVIPDDSIHIYKWTVNSLWCTVYPVYYWQGLIAFSPLNDPLCYMENENMLNAHLKLLLLCHSIKFFSQCSGRSGLYVRL